MTRTYDWSMPAFARDPVPRPGPEVPPGTLPPAPAEVPSPPSEVPPAVPEVTPTPGEVPPAPPPDVPPVRGSSGPRRGEPDIFSTCRPSPGPV